jgi:hypothetical protein
VLSTFTTHKKTPGRPDRSYEYSARRFLALTQICKQIRAEYRPLWLRDSSINLNLDDVKCFITTFFPTTDGYGNAPKLLLISWDHEGGYDEDLLFDITPLLRLRAHCPTLVTWFVCRPLLDGDIPEIECWECGNSVHCGCDNNCDHEEAIDEAFFELDMDYNYTMAIDDFIANGNEMWLKAIRGDSRLHGMKVECTVDVLIQRPTVHIRFSKGRVPAGFNKSSMYKGALRYLREQGIPDLEINRKLDFVIAEHTAKFTRHFESCSYAVPTYN